MVAPEEAAGASPRSVALVGVTGECVGRGGMQRNEPGLAELGPAKSEDAVGEVHVFARERPWGPEGASGLCGVPGRSHGRRTLVRKHLRAAHTQT